MPKRLIAATVRPLRALFVSDAAEGVLLFAVAALAVVAANSAMSGTYHHLFDDPLAWTPVARLDTLHGWINEGLMAVFFFVVGLEVKRELVAGKLAEPASRRLPVLAASVGMAVPALVYLLVAGAHTELRRGWAIPAATDIAFAMGVIGLLGRRVSAALRGFLLTVAIVDDIGAVAIIALVYSRGIDVAWLCASLAVLGALVAMNRLRVGAGWVYAAGALALWACVLHSGVHPTVAGVAAALTVPARGEASPLETMEHALVRWNAYLIVPLFGFANAGVALQGLGFDALFAPLPLAVGAGLVLGKQAGIFGSVYAAERFGWARRPQDASWGQVWGIALLCGIGFTMSLFIAGLAFPGQAQQIEEAKLGVLAGSLLSAVFGYLVLRAARPLTP